MLDEKLEPTFVDVLRRNPGEDEFHQAVRKHGRLLQTRFVAI